MHKYIQLIKNHYNTITVIFLFIITALLILYVLPREGKFRYEYQRGRPWMHETLIAPFNFPIYKSDSELNAERDSVLSGLNKYYIYDSLVYDSVITEFGNYVVNGWASHIRQKYELNNDGFESYRDQNPGLFSLIDRYRNFCTLLFEQVYKRGIIEPGEATDEIMSQDRDIIIVRDNIGKSVSPEDFYQQKTAYEYITKNVNDWVSSVIPEDPSYLEDFVRSVDFSGFTIPNLFYDEGMTSRVRQSLLDEISLARGMVQSGERIVSQGDLITNDIFQILESLKREYETKLIGTNIDLLLLGQLILVFFLMATIYLFLFHFRREVLNNIRKTLFILFLIFLMVFVSMMVVRFSQINFYLLPFAIVPIIIRTFYDDRLALFVHTNILLLVGFFVPNSFEFVLLNFVIGIVAIFSLTNLYRRSKLFLTAFIIASSYSILYFGISIIRELNIGAIDPMKFAWFGGNGLLVLTTYPLIYIFEKTFGFISDSTLIELSDTNQPLLRKLAEEAPGTFQHSIQVANLAEAAIYEIGGNPLLVRAGALYHDIGKMSNPLHFTENQSLGQNPHDSLGFEESAQIIISHVTKGVELARKNNLPAQVIDFIRTHHGTTKVQYFYRSQLKENPNNVDETKYTYPGPKPFSRETAVLMMADSVEAASKSLKEVNQDTISLLVDSIITNQLNDNQFSDSDITFRDISTIKEVYKKKLMNIYHVRIEYPE